MIYESSEWKRELHLKKKQLIKYNAKSAFDKNYDLACHKVESAILYAAFIIRKLIESQKLSFVADTHSLSVKSYLPIRRVDRLHHWCEKNCYDWDKSISKTILGKDICNQLIHSYVFQLFIVEDSEVVGFFVSSDYDRNKGLLEISLADWFQYLDLVISDDIVSLEMRFDISMKDYRIIRKERGPIYSDDIPYSE